MIEKKGTKLETLHAIHIKVESEAWNIKRKTDWKEFEAHFLRLFREVGRAIEADGNEKEVEGGSFFGPKAQETVDSLKDFLVARGILVRGF